MRATEPREERLNRRRERLESGEHTREQCVAPDSGKLHRLQDLEARRLDLESRIGVPIVRTLAHWIHLVENNHLREVRIGRSERVNLKLSELAPEGEKLLRGERLIAEEHDEVRLQNPLEHLTALGGERLAQIDTEHFGANGLCERLDSDITQSAHDPTASPSARVYRSSSPLKNADRRRTRVSREQSPSGAGPDEIEAWVIDADGHVVEPDSIWTDYLPAKFLAYAPRVVEYGDHFRYVCNDRIGFRIYAKSESVGTPGQTTNPSSDPAPTGPALGGTDPDVRLGDMKTDHIGIAALYPTFGLMIQGVTEREPALALCRAVNDWVADYCRAAPQQLLGIATLPMVDPDDAVSEARRCIEELGMRGVWQRPERFDGIPRLHDPAYDALWSTLAEASVPFAIHPGLNGVVPYAYFGDRFDEDYSAMHAAHFPVELMLSLTDLIAFGVLERHPTLRVALLESGAGWALPYLHRLDEHLETFGFPRAKLSMKPSEYFRRQLFVSCEEVEPALDVMLADFPDSVVFASDYPHGDCTFPGSTRELLETRLLDDDARRRILCDNALRLYGIK